MICLRNAAHIRKTRAMTYHTNTTRLHSTDANHLWLTGTYLSAPSVYRCPLQYRALFALSLAAAVLSAVRAATVTV